MSTKIEYFGKTIEIVQGDIVTVEAEALVNAANNELWMGAGVAGAIKRSGGFEIEQEAVSKGPIRVGEVVVTLAGKLPSSYIFHAAVMGQGQMPTRDIIRECTGKCMQLARDLKIKNIAFPALGTGVGGYALEDCADVMVSEVIKMLRHIHPTEKVFFVLFDNIGFSVFEKKVREIVQGKKYISE